MPIEDLANGISQAQMLVLAAQSLALVVEGTSRQACDLRQPSQGKLRPQLEHDPRPFFDGDGDLLRTKALAFFR